ncbi:MAG: rRNA (adenine1518-N6/adenine1519-N6)-dimethyltransferase [Petroclostridium sp.]|jgi:16S rRNA (adenine1518-N6/adenine1519-N6)-dimethyltransferase|uniref:16S rRNA (adenine(1518)-N(6)/adenine(1519)-N(6))- dimethyltransferase RsmA n=1 Tax=Petroclostridium xylanilyticum TaxID=1792311 RepID=UPI000B99C368|nr:16S rRNA (adenine(1518)-N(6)/adenine(1519)-N(6))-dimethyltransferase RsmA [Petroclostridium xylanilyticum]MBZ4646118.1 rsmA [Clostridia bacterium]MDK2809513.1 rRNA (adenine1518-N6/adenine1519-N6)-dimethyltransferase [Petroclostridium sp.]
MDKLSSPKVLKEIITKYGFRFNKNLGQNFLIDSNVLDKIVSSAEIGENTGVIEIGPGIGVLTQALAEKAGKVVAIELDSHLLPILNETLGEYKNVKIINADALKVDMNAIINNEFPNMDVKVAANLPYYITTPIIMGLLEKKLNIDSIIVMVQKEVAERMAAKAGEKDYGALSVAVQYFTKPCIIATVPPHCFMPQPKVESVVIKLDILRQPPVEVEDEKKFFNVVKAAFGQRRKTLVNALSNSGLFTMSKEQIKEMLISIGIREDQRGETLSIMQFAELANAIF